MRQALGVDKIALFGVSYGTKHALAYALAHPTHVERLLLDSEVLPDRDPLDTIAPDDPDLDQRICTNNVCPGIAARVRVTGSRRSRTARGEPALRDRSTSHRRSRRSR